MKYGKNAAVMVRGACKHHAFGKRAMLIEVTQLGRDVQNHLLRIP